MRARYPLALLAIIAFALYPVMAPAKQPAPPRAAVSAIPLGGEIFDGAGSVDVAANGHPVYLPVRHRAGDQLLDYSDPEHPRILEAGVYVLVVNAECLGEDRVLGPCASGPLKAMLGVGMGADPAGDDAVSADQGISPWPIPTPRASATEAFKLSAGDQVGAWIQNYATGALPFRVIMGTLQRVA